MPGWTCLNCGALDNEEVNCYSCSFTKEQGLTMKVEKKKRMCPDCGHRHRGRSFCHVYCEADPDAESEEEEEEVVEDSDDSDDSESDKKKKEVDEDNEKMLPTPPHIKKIGFIRCNCYTGVPIGSKRFESIPTRVLLLDIEVQMYAEINDSGYQFQRKLKKEKYEELHAKGIEKRRLKAVSAVIPHIMSFMHLGQCSNLAKVSPHFYEGVCMYTPYTDMRDVYPWQVIKAHAGQVDAVFLSKSGDRVYTGGDRRINVSSIAQGVLVHTIARDSGDIPYLVIDSGDIFCGSSNGSIRAFALSHDVRNIVPNKTMWGHSRTIKSIMFAHPSIGTCELHGIENHVCLMYTCAEDRIIKIWNTINFKPIGTIICPTLRTSTFQSMTQSGRHLMVGTSDASIAIFSKYDVCERDDIHGCQVPDASKQSCLQITLKLPPLKLSSGNNTSVTTLLCSGPMYTFSHLWAGDSAGQMTIWEIPDYGLDYKPRKTWKAHKGAIRGMSNTWKHMITVSDDGFVLIHCIEQWIKIKSINVLELALYRGLIEKPDVFRRIKCMNIREDFVNGGVMAVGTSYGEVMIFNIGTMV